MTVSTKQTGKACSVPGGLAASGIVSMAVTMGTSIVIAHFLNCEKITWEQAGYWIMGMLFAASFLGGKTAIMAMKHQRILVSFMAGLLYWGILLCITALFFRGDFSAVWVTAGIILAGCGSAALITGSKGKKNRKKVRSTYR